MTTLYTAVAAKAAVVTAVMITIIRTKRTFIRVRILGSKE